MILLFFLAKIFSTVFHNTFYKRDYLDPNYISDNINMSTNLDLFNENGSRDYYKGNKFSRPNELSYSRLHNLFFNTTHPYINKNQILFIEDPKTLPVDRPLTPYKSVNYRRAFV